jgi:O-antigen/teichoic acid export membrane protein
MISPWTIEVRHSIPRLDSSHQFVALAPNKQMFLSTLPKAESTEASSPVTWVETFKQAAFEYLSSETINTGLATFIDQAIVSGTSFCLTVIVARKASKEELGIYVLGLSIVLFVTGLENSLITTPYMFYSPRPNGMIDTRYAGSTLIHTSGLSLAAVTFLAVAAAALSHRVGIPGLGRVIWTLACVIVFFLLREYARRVCFAWRQPSAAIVMDLIAAALQIGGLLVLARMGLLSARAAFWVTGTALCLAGLWWLGSNRRKFGFKLSAVRSDFGLNWSFGKWIVAGGLVYTARSNLYPWFLASFRGTAATATFAACMAITFFANPFFIAFSNFVGPKAAHNFATEGVIGLRRVVYKATFLISAFMAVFAAGIIMVGAKLVVLIYGRRYAGSGAIISVLVLSLLALAASLGIDAALYAMKRPNVIFRANALGFCVTLFFGLWMAKYYGPLGAAYGLLGASLATSTSKYFSFAKLMSSGIPKETPDSFRSMDPRTEVAASGKHQE